MHSNLMIHQAGAYLRSHPLPPECGVSPSQGHHRYLICIREMLRDKYLLIP